MLHVPAAPQEIHSVFT